ncbi:MAG: BglG family transcription antiterminator [Lachnospiraceae bacterium]
MQDKRIVRLLALMEDSKFHTASGLSQHLDVSIKTTRNLLKDLSGMVKNAGAEIIPKHRYGYKLCIVDEHAFQQFKESIENGQDQDNLPSNSRERVQYLLNYLLRTGSYIKLIEISEALYISRNTLSADIREVETVIAQYNLTLVRKPNYGIRIEGSELNIRLCIANCLPEHDYLSDMERLFGEQGACVMKEIADSIKIVLNENKVVISDIVFGNMVYHIYISMNRIREDHAISFTDVDMEGITDWWEYKIAEKIVSELQQNFGITFDFVEIGYLAIHLAGKRIQGMDAVIKNNIVISKDINDIVIRLLENIDRIYKRNLVENLELRVTLCQHIMALAIRIKYELNMVNPILEKIKSEYFLAYAMAVQGCTVLNDHYQTKLSEDEIGYIAVALALALETQKEDVRKKNILLVCSTGRCSAQLLVHKYMQEFGAYIDKISSCNLHELSDWDFTDFDYIFTTVPITGVKVPVPIMEVPYTISSSDILTFRRMLLKGSKSGRIIDYYQQELFLEVDAETKEEVLHFMCDQIRQYKEIPDDFYDLVMERERLARTEFGNYVAIPHPNRAVGNDSFVCVAILKHPIIWDEKKIQVVFLINIGEYVKADLQDFYAVTSKLILNKANISRLIKEKSYDGLMAMLGQIEADNLEGQ